MSVMKKEASSKKNENKNKNNNNNNNKNKTQYYLSPRITVHCPMPKDTQSQEFTHKSCSTKATFFQASCVNLLLLII